MGELAEKLDALTVRVTSPDGQIKARLRNRSEVALKFHPEEYRMYKESVLEGQLAQLFSSLWSGWMSGYRAAVAARGLTLASEAAVADETHRRFLRERHEVVGSGTDSSGRVRAKTRGDSEWKFKLEPGVVAMLDEDEFVKAVIAATGQAKADRNAKIEAFKRECFDHPIAGAAPRTRR